MGETEIKMAEKWCERNKTGLNRYKVCEAQILTHDVD